MGASLDSEINASALALGVEQFSRWREKVSSAIADFARWLEAVDLMTSETEQQLLRVFEQVESDRLSLAFVAEFSRGKSELINALFFSQFDERIVPSGSGRTTMCPTEFFWDGRSIPSIRLLPIETRASDTSLSDYRNTPAAWHVFEFDPSDSASIKAAIAKVCETRFVPLEEAHSYGLASSTEEMRSGLNVVEIPRWRHAIVNYPHPLFLQGLRIIDTPGLNALGSEPELTNSLLPSAHALLFLLGMDTGVTASDLDIWRTSVRPGQLCYAILNKIDGLWDGLRSPAEINSEIQKQVAAVSLQLGLPQERIFPLSAQRALAGRINADQGQIRASRIEAFEQALVQELVPSRYKIISEQTKLEYGRVVHNVRWRLVEDQRLLSEQVIELQSLRGKNRSAIQQTATRIKAERQDFEAGLRLMRGLKAAHTNQSNKALGAISIDNLKRHVRVAREQIGESRLSVSLHAAMRAMIEAARADIVAANTELKELHEMMIGIHRSFATQFGIGLPSPLPFDLQLQIDEVDAVAAQFARQFGALSLLTHEKWVLARKFFESIALELKRIYLSALTDAGAWSRNLLVPIESQLSAQREQLNVRMESVKRVLEASDALDERLAQLRIQIDTISLRLKEIDLNAELATAAFSGH